MVDVNIANFITVGLMALVFQAAYQWAMGMYAGHGPRASAMDA